MAKSRRRNKKQSKLSKLLASSRSVRAARERLFEDFTAGEIESSFSKIGGHRYFTSAAQLTLSGEIENTYSVKTPDSNLEKNVAWCLGLVIYHQKRLGRVLSFEKELMLCISGEDYSRAVEILNMIDATCGVSIWSLSIRGAIESKFQEISDSDKVSSLLNGVPKNTLLSYVVEYSADYYRDDQIFFTASKTHSRDIERSAPEFLKDFFLYRWFQINADRAYDFDSIFNMEKNSSILDIFFLLLEFLTYSISPQGNTQKVQPIAARIIKSLIGAIDHPTVTGVANFYGFSSEWIYKNEDRLLVDLYTEGKYKEVCELANKRSIYEYDISILELVVKSNIRSRNLDTGSPSFILIELMQDVLLKNENYQSSLEKLACICHRYRSLRWFKQLSYFTQRESASIPNSSRVFYDQKILLSSEVSSPRASMVVSENIRQQYLCGIKGEREDSISVLMYEYLTCGDKSSSIASLNIEPLRAKKYLALALANNSNHDEAISILRELVKSEDGLITIESTRLLIDVLLESGKVEEALEFFVAVSLKSKNLFSIFDTSRILDSVKSFAKASDSINVPIAYSLHSRYINSIYDSNLKFSFENFLRKNKKVFPQDLFGCEEQHDKNKLYYFLRWVCVPEVMKLYFEFDSPRHIEECRLDICTYLLENNEKQLDLQNELKEINRSHVTKKAAKKVENSRIYVDTSTFYGRDSKPLKTLFERYKELASEDYSNCNDDIEMSQVFNLLKDGKEELTALIFPKALSMILMPHLKLNKRNAAFLSLAKLVISEFTHGERGLNNHLSTRIRHGVLPTALLKPLNDEGLYIQEDMKLDEFRERSKWSALPVLFNSDETDSIWKALRTFSEKFSLMVSEINDEWLQIYTLEAGAAGIIENKGKSTGLFNYSTTPLECFYLQQELPISPQYDDFIQVVVKWLWDRTEYNLIEVQKQIRQEFQPNANSLLEELRKSVVDDCYTDHAVSEFSNSVSRAHNTLTNQVELVCSWFTHEDVEEGSEYEIETAIDIAKRSLNVDLSVLADGNCTLNERTLIYFVDVFFILFDNAISKSNISKSEIELMVQIDSINNEQLVIKTTNSCWISDEVEIGNATLDFYRSAYGDESLIKDVIQGEGGTGFFKIWKILEKDLEIPHEIAFGYEAKDKFSVTLKLYKSKSLDIR